MQKSLWVCYCSLSLSLSLSLSPPPQTLTFPAVIFIHFVLTFPTVPCLHLIFCTASRHSLSFVFYWPLSSYPQRFLPHLIPASPPIHSYPFSFQFVTFIFPPFSSIPVTSFHFPSFLFFFLFSLPCRVLLFLSLFPTFLYSDLNSILFPGDNLFCLSLR